MTAFCETKGKPQRHSIADERSGQQVDVFYKRSSIIVQIKQQLEVRYSILLLH